MPNDPFVVQQLALATYKAKEPDLRSGLEEAKNISRFYYGMTFSKRPG